MLDNKSIELIMALSEIISDNNLKVLDRSDINAKLEDELDNAEMDDLLTSLKYDGYLVIKMLRPEEVCLKITDAGRHYIEEITALASAKKKKIVNLARDAKTGKTIVEFEDTQSDAETDTETAASETALTVSTKKEKKKHYGLISVVSGFIAGAISSIAAILIFVYGLGGM